MDNYAIERRHITAIKPGDTARMNTLEIVEFLNDHRPEGQNN